MTDEKQNGPDLDAWLDDLEGEEEGTEFDEIDQASIDELLAGTGEADGQQADSDQDLKADLEAGPQTVEEASADSGEIDQASIDELLAGTGEADGQQADSDQDLKADLEAEPQTAEEARADSGEIDQTSIDELLAGTDEADGQQATEEARADSGEIDQASIDELLAGTDEADGQQAESDQDLKADLEAGPQTAEKASADSGEIDQASLDALLNGDAGNSENSDAADAAMNEASIGALLDSDNDDFQAALEDTSNVPSQSDIDELFAQAQKNGPAAPAEANPDPNALLAEGSPGGFPAGGKTSDPDEETVATGLAPNTIPREERTSPEDIFGEELSSSRPTAAAAKWQRLLPYHLFTRAPRSSALWGALLAAMLLLAGGTSYVVLHHRAPITIVPPPVSASKASVPTPLPAVETAPPVAETPPTAKNLAYQMPEGGGEVSLLLAGKDQNGNTLSYKITTPPQHGRLAGKLPTPIYLPNKNFPGEDVIKYRVSDGKEYSKPATILITGPDLQPSESGMAQQTAASPPQPRQPVLQAPDITLKTLSTRELVIDWRKIWQQANSGPFVPEIRVEIVGKDLHGRLIKIGPRKDLFHPDLLYSGSDIISYRFRLGKTTSRAAELRLLVEEGDFPPEIRFRSLPKKSYLVGDTAVLDASPTIDDDPPTLTFTWRQIAGTPVKLKKLNAKGSMVSFVVPSFFSTEQNPGPVLQLTVTDRSGHQARKLVKIASRSRRHSPLWHGDRLEAGCLSTGSRQGPSALLPGTVVTR